MRKTREEEILSLMNHQLNSPKSSHARSRQPHSGILFVTPLF